MQFHSGQINNRKHMVGAWLRAITPLVLLLSASLKAYQLATVPVLGDSVFQQRWLLLILMGAESLWAARLLFGIWASRTWGLTVAMWAIFSAVNLYAIFSGRPSCGCFGRVHVAPAYALILDLVGLAAVLIAGPGTTFRSGLPRARGTLLASLIAISMACGVFGAWDLKRFSSSRLADEGIMVAGATIVLEPDRWIGRQFNLFDDIDKHQILERGDWLVLFYRSDCDHCQRAVEHYAQWVRDGHSSMIRVAMIEVPPYLDNAELAQSLGPPIISGRLADTYEWVMTTPVVIRLKDGSVLNTWQGDAAEQPPATLGAADFRSSVWDKCHNLLAAACVASR